MTTTNRILQRIGDIAGDHIAGDQRVFAEPVSVDGVTVIPATRITGVIARPVGALVITDGRVRWKPTIDVTRIVLGGQLVGIAYFVSAWLVARSRRALSTLGA